MRPHLEHRFLALVGLRHSVHAFSLLFGGLRPGPTTRFHSKSMSSKGLEVIQPHKLLEGTLFSILLLTRWMLGAFLPNFPCGNNAMSSSKFIPGNAIWEAVVPLTVVNVVVLGAIIHQATIWAPIGACPGTQKACSRVTTLATFSSRHGFHVQR